jgi:eukaryotic-like serine/threonine-protein kinase
MTGGAYPGARFGRIRLERPAGEGRRPGVWRGRDIRGNQPVAIEVLDAWPGSDQVARASFGERMAAIAQLRHVSIAAVLDYGFHDETAYVVSEWVGSTTLASLGPRQAPRASSLRLTLGRLASALSAAHDAGVPHLDVQPGSVALGRRRGPQMTDFLPSGPPLVGEVARLVGAPPAYWSPELLSAGIADASADAYGLGMLLYDLVAGASAALGGREHPARCRLGGDLPPLAEIAPTLARTDMALCALCDELVGRNPTMRPTLAESADRLLATLGRAGVRQRAGGVRAAEPRPRLERADFASVPVEAKVRGLERQASQLRPPAHAQPGPGATAPQVGQIQEAGTQVPRRPPTALRLLGTACLLTLIIAGASRKYRRERAQG